MKLDASPNARRKMSDKDRLLVRMAQPEDHTASVLYSDGWTVKITTPRPVTNVGEAHRYFTFAGGFAAAMADFHKREAAA